jgi:hypothetical protein
MRSVIVLLILLAGLTSNSQTNYIVDKKGNKTIIRDDVGEVILIDKRISYTLVGKTWEKYIKFDDLDFAAVGNCRLKSFRLNKKRKSSIYYVFAEKSDKKLIGIAITVTLKYSSRTFFQLCVIDNNDTIIEEVDFNSTSKTKENQERAKLAPMVRKHFSDCPDLINRLNRYDYPDDENRAIIGFFNNPEYITCK